MEPILQEIYDGILNGEWKTVETKVQAALESKISPKDILDQGMVSAMHEVGKNLVAMMLEGADFEILDLGADVAPEKFVDVADQVDVIALSALLTTTMQNMKVTIEALKSAGKRDKVKVIIGGAPVTEEYAHQIGADGE